MPTLTSEKSFDCIAFKRAAARKIYEETKGMTPEEEIAYFRRAVETGPFAEWIKRVDEAAKERGTANRSS